MLVLVTRWRKEEEMRKEVRTVWTDCSAILNPPNTVCPRTKIWYAVYFSRRCQRR